MVAKMMGKVVIITSQGFEDVEVIYPYYRLLAAGFIVDIATENGLDVNGKFGVPISSLVKPNSPIATSKLKVKDYDLVIIPGGHVAPDKLRLQKEVLGFIRGMNEENKLVASICHGPWVLISSKILKGITATCYPSMVDDLVNAGARYVDEAVVVCKNIITSRRPRDLPVFMETIIHHLNSQNFK